MLRALFPRRICNLSFVSVQRRRATSSLAALLGAGNVVAAQLNTPPAVVLVWHGLALVRCVIDRSCSARDARAMATCRCDASLPSRAVVRARVRPEACGDRSLHAAPSARSRRERAALVRAVNGARRCEHPGLAVPSSRGRWSRRRPAAVNLAGARAIYGAATTTCRPARTRDLAHLPVVRSRTRPGLGRLQSSACVDPPHERTI